MTREMSVQTDAHPGAPSAPGAAAAIGLGGVLLVGVVLSAALVVAEWASASGAHINWILITCIGAAAVVSELVPRTWIAIGRGGAVTLLPAFAYALILLGSPTTALAIATLATMLSKSSGSSRWRRAFEIGRTVVSVAAAGLVLFAVGAAGSVAQFDRLPWRWSVAIVLCGVAMLVLDSIVSEIGLGLTRRTSFVPALRRVLAMRFTAVGSLLSLSPIWVIGLNSSLVLAPLLAITTVLVWASMRRALTRADEAHHDSLTGLPNRRSFSQHMTDAVSGIGAPGTGVLLVMDLVGFKDVNDKLGHDVGDAVLVAFAERLAASVPPNAFAARLGGDEFAVLLTWPRRGVHTERVVNELYEELIAPLIVDGFPLSVGVSIGTADIPDDGRSEAALMRAADIAMYQSKRLGTAVQRYERDGTTLQTGRLGLLRDLGNAIRDNELRVDYQPQLAMHDGSIVAVEALVRWQHPVHGTIAPMDFIGLAEHTDLIGPITDTVLRVAGGGLLMTGRDDIRLALNVSVRNLQDPGFARQTLELLAHTGLSPRRLELEVTERALVTNAERSIDTIAHLRSEGVTVTVDGFGTGYASYQTLRTLSVDRIKIDRDFVVRLLQDPSDRAIVRSVIDLAHELGLDVVAEGVEADQTWDLLARMGCDAAQGFGIAMPMPLGTLCSWVSQWNSVARTGQS
jgi:diguanylate cyclase (GGDEF)-like protein